MIRHSLPSNSTSTPLSSGVFGGNFAWYFSFFFFFKQKTAYEIYYVNKKRYTFHKDFVNGTYLSLERGREFFVNNYIKPNRRFILGTLAYQTPIKRWTFEFWEGDLIPADQIQLAYDVINKTFFAPVAFKPNSLRQEEATRALAG